MQFYFRLQYLRFIRLLREAGINPILACLIMLVIFGVSSNVLISSVDHGSWIYTIIVVYMFSKVQNVELVTLIFPNATIRKLRICEALIFSSPFSIFLFLNQYYLQGVVLYVLAIVYALLDVRTSFSITIPTPFSRRPFEFIVGFRKTWIVFFLIYGLCFIAVSVGNFNLGIFSILVGYLTMLGFYASPEDEFFVWVYSKTPKDFLVNKAMTALLYSSVMMVPLVIIMLVVFPSNWWLTLIILCAGNLLLFAGFLNKYSYFPSDSELINGILLGLCIFFPPLLLVLIPYLLSKASENLKNYL